jgi:acyl-CoA thioester hydrolase
MARVKIDLPASFTFTTSIPVRITDINYGGHVGNDTILSIIHEARVLFLKHHGYAGEMNVDGIGLIMADVAIEFKKELFYGDTVIAAVTATEFSKVSFELYYLLEKEVNGLRTKVAVAKTGMVCYDYEKKKVAAVPESVISKLSN